MAGKWPTTATDSDLYIAVNELQNNLSGAVNSAVTTLPLNSATGFPTVGLVLIDNEVIQYTGISTNNLTGCTRGFDGTTAAAHSSSAIVSFAVMAAHHNVLKDETIAIETDLAGVLLSIAGATPGATATSITNRMAQVTQQIKNILGSTNWYDAFTQIKAPDGTANAPGLTFTTQTNMGLYRFGTDTVGIAVGGVNRVQFATTATIFNKPIQMTVATNKLTLDGSSTTGQLGNNYDVGTIANTSNTSANINLNCPTTNATVTVGTSDTANTAPTTRATFQSPALGGCQLFGTTAGDSAAAGVVGEAVRSFQSVATNYPTTGTYGDLTSISLTAGDWDVTGIVAGFSNGTTTIPQLRMGIGTTSGNVVPGQEADALIINPGSTTSDVTQVCPALRVSISATTTVYLKHYAQFTGTAPQAIGRISARRVR